MLRVAAWFGCGRLEGGAHAALMVAEKPPSKEGHAGALSRTGAPTTIGARYQRKDATCVSTCSPLTERLKVRIESGQLADQL